MRHRAAAALACLMLLTLAGCASPRRLRVALVLTANKGYYWETMLEGAQLAAEEMNCELLFDAPANEGDYAVQLLIAKRMCQDNADILVISPSDAYAAGAFIDTAPVPVVCVESPAQSRLPIKTIMCDASVTGALIAREILRDSPPSAQVAVIFSKSDIGTTQVQSDALTAAIEDAGGTILARRYCRGSEETAYQQALEILSQHPEVTAFAAMNAQAAQGASRAVLETGSPAFIVGLESSAEEVEYLEAGVIHALIVQNAFALGYRSVEYAANVAMGHIDMLDYAIEPQVVTLENLYTPQIEKLVFPFKP